ncbi:MAG: hypothetical protein KBT73_00045 [Marinobacter sp.]|uniref:hypothetical protein n=1 Tax=uncultured Marinobacter sp. TaxID=187379 RepID=UPI001B6791EF|nr:hypothetical protein [Marinobacter sp.]|tara:strand:- start:1124 stop:1291 length:168 start_codon:yes stop_codon:yes gene_type:complete
MPTVHLSWMKVAVLALILEACSESLKNKVASYALRGVAGKYIMVSLLIEFEHMIF